jgi:SAM-dependent methyltransferase
MKLNICCTKHRNIAGYTCVDIVDADIIADLNKDFPFESDSVDEIKAYDAIEHLTDPIHTMNEIYRVLKLGGIADIFVPSTDGRGAFQDPTHKSFWNENSFMYYTTNYPAYLDLCRQYGFYGKFELVRLRTTPKDLNDVCHVYAMLKKV